MEQPPMLYTMRTTGDYVAVPSAAFELAQAVLGQSKNPADTLSSDYRHYSSIEAMLKGKHIDPKARVDIVTLGIAKNMVAGKNHFISLQDKIVDSYKKVEEAYLK
ncbi:MAG: hypothetical protein ABIB43_04055 [archaeon]